MISISVTVVCIAVIDSDPPELVTEKCLEAKRMLDTWKSSYFSTRAKIEESGRDSRWEFDRKRLFERTDYMAKICQDLANIGKVSLRHWLSQFDCHHPMRPVNAWSFFGFTKTIVNIMPLGKIVLSLVDCPLQVIFCPWLMQGLYSLDLLFVLQALHEFHSIFTSDLKSVTGEVKLIDSILIKVDSLIEPINSVSV